MNYKSFYFTTVAMLSLGTAIAQTASDDVIILDLSKATTSLSFDESNGMWEGTYDDDETEIESQVFSIVHGSYAEWKTWWGFTASNSTDNKFQSEPLTYQFSNMALGGILLNEDGSIKTNDFGAPVTGKEMPYLVGYPKSEILFNTDKSYEVVGAYFNLNSYTFYSLLYGDSYSRAFTDGDDLKLIVHGVDMEEKEKIVEISLASFNNGSLTTSTGWKYVDLSSLGEVEEIYFTMTSTDSGEWGMNTPGYFCLDKLMVRESSESSFITDIDSGSNRIFYDRFNKVIKLGNSNFAIIYDSVGRKVMSVYDSNEVSVENLPGGVYVVKSGNNRLKFVR